MKQNPITGNWTSVKAKDKAAAEPTPKAATPKAKDTEPPKKEKK